MKTQYNDYNLNCAAIDKASINKRQWQMSERKKRHGKGFGEILQRAMKKIRRQNHE